MYCKNIWIWLNHTKGQFKRSQRSNLAPFLQGQVSQKLSDNLSLCIQEASQGGY